MNGKLRVLISAALLVITLTLGVTLAREDASTTLAGTSQPLYEFIGPISALPEDMTGIWVIGDTQVEVTQHTNIDEVKGRISPGVWVRVRARRTEDGRLYAELVRVLPPNDVPGRVEVHGIVQKVQDDVWLISGKYIRVTRKTRIQGDVRLRRGSVASVRGHLEGTTIVADEIVLTAPEQERTEVEFLGRLDEVRGNIWVVNGIEVVAPENVPPPPIGTLVSVRGQSADGVKVIPKQLAVEAEPSTRLEGWLVDADNTQGTWEVVINRRNASASRQVRVRLSPDTPVDERAGVAEPGARVEVLGSPADEDVVVASFARVLEPQNVYLTGTLVYIPSGDPYAYPWTVDETQVWLRPTTVTDRPIGEFRLGDRVAVSGWRQADGSVVALMISRSKR